MDPGWESVKILSRIAKVVIEEVLGYNAELHEGILPSFMSSRFHLSAPAFVRGEVMTQTLNR
jgi:hypothetical protein